jgi:alpha-beta hydrolase superfamily lysophospholipase
MSYYRRYVSTLVTCLALTGFPFSAPTHAGTSGSDIVSKTAEVDGIKLHYLTAGHGPALILLHGYTQTSHMWRPIMPSLSDRYTVIAPDLPGIGESEIPASGDRHENGGHPHS